MVRWSEEEYLLRQAKHRSYIDPNDRNDLPGSSRDRDVRHKLTRKKGTQKYLRESCYHRIECTAATFLTVFMWRISLNSVRDRAPSPFYMMLGQTHINGWNRVIAFQNGGSTDYLFPLRLGVLQ